jgi:hypothetical protein
VETPRCSNGACPHWISAQRNPSARHPRGTRRVPHPGPGVERGAHVRLSDQLLATSGGELPLGLAGPIGGTVRLERIARCRALSGHVQTDAQQIRVVADRDEAAVFVDH